LMRTFVMIMIDELADRRSEVRFAEEHHSIQALRLGGPDKSFGERVQIGCGVRKLHPTHAARSYS